MHGWYIVKVRDNKIPMGRPEFDTSINMNAVFLMIRLNIALWNTGNTVIMYIGSCVLKGILEIRDRGIYVSELIKIDTNGLRGFMEK